MRKRLRRDAYFTTSQGETVPIQQSDRQTQSHLARQQRKSARKQKGSKRSDKQKNRVARIHQGIGRIRENFHYNTAESVRGALGDTQPVKREAFLGKDGAQLSLS